MDRSFCPLAVPAARATRRREVGWNPTRRTRGIAWGTHRRRKRRGTPDSKVNPSSRFGRLPACGGGVRGCRRRSKAAVQGQGSG
jgi:hypothetical protein